jgi:organic hydroperoxide reductase OsmC/OhrA
MAAHHYAVDLRWEGNAGTGTADYRTYDRRFRAVIAGKPDLVGSADAAFRGDASVHNPEDLLVVALSSCHMLSYLALCARRGIGVVAYADRARGRMIMENGQGRFDEVVLEPHVTISATSDEALALALHEDAAASCFIARSVNFPVHHRPVIVRRSDLAVP